MKDTNKPTKGILNINKLELKLNYNSLKNFTGSNKLKKVALTFIAS